MNQYQESRLFTRAAALVAALTVTTVIVDVIAEIGHPPPEGFTVLTLLSRPVSVIPAVHAAPAVAENDQGTSLATTLAER
ncbi:MAG: hypothetical protein V4684_05775 [Pseudomonadota bacterium]